MTVFTEVPLSNSIFTYDPVLPDLLQVIVLVVPLTQLCPPLGEVAVIELEEVEVSVVKTAFKV
jgi:hypothetical protein